MKLQQTGILICLLLTTFFSCKKTPARVKTSTDYLIQSPWKETSVEYKTSNGVWISKPVSASDRSNSYVYTTDGAFTVYSSDHHVVDSGTWIIIGEGSQIAINSNVTYNFSIINDSTMQLALDAQIDYTDPDTGNTTTYYGFHETFSH